MVSSLYVHIINPTSTSGLIVILETPPICLLLLRMLSGIVVTALLSATAASALTYQNVSEGYSPADKTCEYLYRTFPDITSFSNQSSYIVDNTSKYHEPACPPRQWLTLYS